MAIHNLFKKGFSPLVATILLIAFSVALVSTVINWKGSLGVFNDDVCSKISFKIETLEDRQLCYKPVSNNVEVDFLIKNNGKEDIEGISMLIIGTNGKIIQDLDNLIIKGGSVANVKNLQIDYDINEYGPISKVYFTPKVESDGIKDICPTLLTEANKVVRCS